MATTDPTANHPLAVTWAPRALSVLRIVAAFLFMQHGTQKLFGFPLAADAAPRSIELFSQMGLAGVLEVVGGGLILIGLFTRPIAFLLSGEMAVAYFMAHQPRGALPALNGGEASVLFCFIFLYFFVRGAGVWSIDAMLAARRAERGEPSLGMASRA